MNVEFPQLFLRKLKWQTLDNFCELKTWQKTSGTITDKSKAQRQTKCEINASFEQDFYE